jgi:hypothetical protein
MKMTTAEERQLKYRSDLDALMNALVSQRRELVATAMGSLQENVIPPRLAVEIAEVQDGINAVALAKRQEEMFSVMCKSWDYLLLSPKEICEDVVR